MFNSGYRHAAVESQLSANPSLAAQKRGVVLVKVPFVALLVNELFPSEMSAPVPAVVMPLVLLLSRQLSR